MFLFSLQLFFILFSPAWATTPPPTIPSQVNRPTVTKAVSSGRPALTVSWSEPQSDRNITKYEVQYKKIIDSNWMSRDVVTSISTTLTNLDAGTEYIVQVRAVSGLGDGPFSMQKRQITFNVSSPVTGVMLSVPPGQAAITVTWEKPSSDRPIIRYEAEYGINHYTSASATTVSVLGADTLTVTIIDLQRGVIYVVHVRAVSDAGNGSYNAFPDQRIYIPNFPPQVTGVSLSVISRQAAIRVSWTKPSVEGTFIRYDVQYKTSSQSWNASTTETVTVTVENQNVSTVDLTTLQRGTTYNVHVRALSNAGTGPYSAEHTATVPNAVPSKVNPPTVTKAVSSALNVSWTAPKSDSSITKYELQFRKTPSGDWISRDVTSTSTALTNLNAGTEYAVRVRAVSAVGSGPFSMERMQTTFNVPSQVNRPTVTKAVSSGRPALTVSWSAPQSDSPITKYELQYKKTSDSWISRDVTSTSNTLPNLYAGTEYAVQVRAVSGAGEGPFSNIRMQTTFSVPSQVTGVKLSVVSGQAALRVTWNKPLSDRPIIRYHVQYGPSPAHPDRWTSPIPVQGADSLATKLTRLGRRGYDVRVLAVSDFGLGLYSATSTLNTSRVPSQVNPPTVTKVVFSGRPALTVSWSATQSDSSITKYELQYRQTPSGDWMSRDVTSPSTTLPNLDAGTEYSVRVRAVSGIGNGPFSMERRQTTFNVPSQVNPPTVTKAVSPGRPALNVSWSAPQTDRTITKYELQYRKTPSGDWMSRDVTSTSTTLTNIDAGTEYTVQVRAVSGIGNGPFSMERRQTTFNGPSGVSSVNFTISENRNSSVRISLTWKVPASEPEVPITHYEVMYRESEMTKPTFNSSTPAATINGTANKKYFVCIKAVSAVGAGGKKCTNIAPPTPPTVSTTSITTTTINVTWTDVGFKYRLYLQRHGTELRTPPSPVSPPHTITGLDSNTGYTITVEAYSPLGSNGTDISVYTVPEVPSSLNLKEVSSTVIRVTWTAPPNADRLALTYLISYQSEFDSGMEETSTANHELIAHGLHPFAEYTVRVQSNNTGGQLSGNVTGQSTTLSAAPSSPPRIVGIVDKLKTHNSLTWTWQLPVKAGRNGIISSYFIIFARVSSEEHQPVGNFTRVVDNPSFYSPTRLTYTFNDLSPHTFYSIRIAAVTSGGTGVFSALQKTNTTLDLYVSMLTVDVNSNSSSNISWVAPREMSSVTSYTVYYGVYENTTASKTTPVPSTRLNNLSPETPIEVSVKPVTGQGSGGPVSKIFFTREGVPTVPVKDVTVIRINSDSLRVSWTPLSLHEARGWPLYTVIVESTAARTTRATLTSNTNDSTVDVDGLDPSTWYSVRVQVGTSAGTNELLISDPVFLEPLPTAAIAAVLVVIILLVIAIVITVVVIVFLYRARKKSAKSFSPSQSESEVDIKGGKGNSVQMMALSSNSEKHDILEGRISNIKNENNPYTVTTSMGASVSKSDFASHVLMMQKDRDSGFEKEYMSIINDPEGVEAIAKANKLKNRYINIHTFDHSRVVLTVPDENGSDYINASYIDGYKKDNAYIASQGPTPSTITDFWQMIVDHKAPVIVMLTRVEEKGKKKCEQYWEETLNTKVDKGRGIQVTTVKFTPYADYEVREFHVTSSSSPSVQPLKVKHFLYTAWPDHGVPQHPSSLVRFTHKVRRAYQNSAAPIIVHCSAGVGRTGTYLTIDAMMQRIREVDDLNIYEFVVEMRSKRTFMVQNQDQYAFIHDALCDHITCGDTSIPAHELRRITIGMEANDPKTNKSGFEQQFEFLDSLSKTPCVEDVKFAKKNTISKKNRHRDRCAYSNNHLHIPGKSASNGSDYINASYVDSYSRKNAFIAAQTPLPSTVADFWELLWQFKPPTVVVLTSADDDKDVADFWPTQEEGVADYGVVKVNHKATMPCSDYDRHSLEVVDKRKDKCTPYNLTLFHFKVWSLDSTPYLPSLLDMMGEVERCHSGSTKSIAVACSDGMSRTGVFISTMSEVERVKTESEVDLFQTIKLARAKRPFMVFTVEQYKLCFDILQAYLDSFDTYANFKVV